VINLLEKEDLMRGRLEDLVKCTIGAYQVIETIWQEGELIRERILRPCGRYDEQYCKRSQVEKCIKKYMKDNGRENRRWLFLEE